MAESRRPHRTADEDDAIENLRDWQDRQYLPGYGSWRLGQLLRGKPSRAVGRMLMVPELMCCVAAFANLALGDTAFSPANLIYVVMMGGVGLLLCANGINTLRRARQARRDKMSDK